MTAENGETYTNICQQTKLRDECDRITNYNTTIGIKEVDIPKGSVYLTKEPSELVNVSYKHEVTLLSVKLQTTLSTAPKSGTGILRQLLLDGPLFKSGPDIVARKFHFSQSLFFYYTQFNSAQQEKSLFNWSGPGWSTNIRRSAVQSQTLHFPDKIQTLLFARMVPAIKRTWRSFGGPSAATGRRPLTEVSTLQV